MSKYFLCTLGTSVANGLDRDVLNRKQRSPGNWDDADPAFQKALDGLVAGALREKESFHKRCAEATVLRMADAGPGDRVVLLATDTGLGRICGEATKRLLVSGFGFGDADVELVRIPGLQVSDAERLRREGLPGFVKAVVSRIDANQFACEIFLCPVGGYKGIVPFLTVLGMAYRLPVLYAFEFINSLVRLPPLPFSLDRDLYARAKDALREIGSRTEMPEGEFLSKIRGYSEEERDVFLSFVEPSSRPGFVTSGAFTETFAPDFECETAKISPKALEDLEILSHGQWYRTACRMVIGSQDPIMRNMWNHEKTIATDLRILKQGRTNVRLLGYERGRSFYVCRVFDHEDYDKKLDSRSCWKKNFPPESFLEWSMPPEVLPDSVRDEESPFESAMRQLADAERKLAETVSAWAARANELKSARATAEKGLKKTQRNLDLTKQALAEKSRETERLRGLVEESRRRVGELEAGSGEELRAAQAETARLEERLRSAEETRRKEEDAHEARYEDAVRQIGDLRRKLRAAQAKIAMAPQDVEAVREANREIAENNKRVADAFATLLMSDKTVPRPTEPSDEERALRTELRQVRAQLIAKSGEAGELETENASLASALREANERLARETGGNFLVRLRRLFRP